MRKAFVDRWSLRLPLRQAIETLVIAVLLGTIHFASASVFQDFYWKDWRGIRWIAILMSLCPMALGYLLLRFAFPPLIAAALLGVLSFALGYIHWTKLGLTAEPLVWADLRSTNNYSIVFHYLSVSSSLLLLLLTMIIFASAFRARRTWWASLVRGSHLRIVGCCVLLPIVLSPYAVFLNGKIAGWVEFGLKQGGVDYVYWDWDGNVKKNGLLFHLVQTSVRRLPNVPSPSEVQEFTSLSQPKVEGLARPPHIIAILCESCWHDAQFFSDSFSPLVERGFVSFRTISPVYGGNTANASFEFLTGLPSQGGGLKGIVYQEYADFMRPDVYALPRSLVGAGYQTVVIHNHKRKFWNRDKVKPKLGFQSFISLEDMPHDGSPFWADDAYLYDAALNVIKESKSSPLFLYLITVYNHGGYKGGNDFGASDYHRRLSFSIKRMASFVDAARKEIPDALFVVYGDHKPGLTRFFYENNVLTKEQFDLVGNLNESFKFSSSGSLEVRGDVPAYAAYPAKDRLKRFAEQASGKPLFCLSYALNSEFLHAGLPALEYAKRKSLCDRPPSGNYREVVTAYPPWLYYLSMFGNQQLLPK